MITQSSQARESEINSMSLSEVADCLAMCGNIIELYIKYNYFKQDGATYEWRKTNNRVIFLILIKHITCIVHCTIHVHRT